MGQYAFVNRERTKKGLIVAELPRAKKGHKYKIIPASDGFYTKVFVVDVLL